MFGHDIGRSFATQADCITRRNAATLRPGWFYNSGSPITAQPVVSSDIVYAGSYDGMFHAVNKKTGKSAWPKPFNTHRYDNNITDFGAIPGSAAVVDFFGGKVVFFGGGATLFALDARTGALLDKICLDRVDTTCQGKAGYPTEIESSPAAIFHPGVAEGGGGYYQVLVGTDVNEESPAGPAGLVSVRFQGGRFLPDWWFDPEAGVTYRGLAPTQTKGHLTENGCNDVWSSPSVDTSVGMVFFGVGNCNHPDRVKRAAGITSPKLVEGTMAVDLATGAFRWQFSPRKPANGLDLDFGATPNVLSPGVVGEAGKDGVYYVYEARSGRLLWQVKVAEGSEVGGVIASTAVGKLSNGHQAVFLASAIPVSTGDPASSVQDAATHPTRAFGVHAIDTVTHKIVWSTPLGPNYGAPSFASHLLFVPNTFSNSFQVLGADRGIPVRMQPMNQFPASPPAISGDMVFLGAGITEAIPVVEQLGRLGGLWGFTTTT
jgi:outer membrane protein assembly factor BamB